MRIAVLLILLWGQAPAHACLKALFGLGIFSRHTQIAVLGGEGSAENSVKNISKILGGLKGTKVTTLSPSDIAKGKLLGYAALVVPGGRASGQFLALGTAGQTAIREFVDGGGGYVGICAGAYLAADEPDRYGLSLAAVRVLDRAHWRRGMGYVTLAPEADFTKLPWPDEIAYANGPLLEPTESRTLAAVTPLARFSSDISSGTPLEGTMPGTLGAVRTTYGKGRVVLISPHPEFTDGGADLLRQLVTWANRRVESR